MFVSSINKGFEREELLRLITIRHYLRPLVAGVIKSVLWIKMNHSLY